MSPVAHLQYGWWFAHWGDFSRKERAVIALAGAGPDLDGIFLFGGAEIYHRSARWSIRGTTDSARKWLWGLMRA